VEVDVVLSVISQGWPAFVGVAIMVISIPLNTVIGRYIFFSYSTNTHNHYMLSSLLEEFARDA
jgi:hypothetical protein